MSLTAMTLTTASAPAVAAFARLVGYSCTQLVTPTPTSTPTEPATAPAPALARALARVRLSPSTSTTTTTSMMTTTSANINTSSSAVATAAPAAAPATDESTLPTICSVTSSAVAAITTVRDAATAACACVVGKFAHVVSCCCTQLSLSTCWAKSVSVQPTPMPPASGSPTPSPKTDFNSTSTISRGAMAPIRSNASAIVSHHASSSSSASTISTASSSDELSASSTFSTAATTTTTTTTPALSTLTTTIATTTTQLPSATPTTTPTVAPSSPRRAWPVVRPWAGVADIERTTIAPRGYFWLPDAEERERSHRLQMLQITEPEQDLERYWHALDTQGHARLAVERLVLAAVRQSDEPPHEDPPMYACRCGHCPDDTASYTWCAAATIRSNLVQLSRVNRATASVASESLQRQNACFRRARCVFSPTRG